MVQNYSDLDQEFRPIFNKCKSMTMTSVDRLYALYKAVEYISLAKISGDVVECGVSMMCVAHSLVNLNDTTRQLYLYDTFDGTVEPDSIDIDHMGLLASHHLAIEDKSLSSHVWAYAPIDVVRTNMSSTLYPKDHVHYVCGNVIDTIPETIPNQIALLRFGLPPEK